MNVNGEEYTKNYLTHSVLQNGGRIEISMSSKPDMSRGTAQEDLPYSFSNEMKY